DRPAVAVDGLDSDRPRARVEVGPGEADGSRAGVDHPVDAIAVPAHYDDDTARVLARRTPFASPRAVERETLLSGGEDRQGAGRGRSDDPHPDDPHRFSPRCESHLTYPTAVCRSSMHVPAASAATSGG